MCKLLAVGSVIAAALMVAIAAGATTPGPADLATSNLNTAPGHLTALKGKAAYQASAFPLAVRVTPPDGTWAGSQWTTSSHGKRMFGWLAVGHGGTTATSPPDGLITIVTAFGSTRSVAATVARIRAGGSGITFEASTPVTIAGFSGTQFDGNVWGIYGHTFVPFTPKTHGASPADSWHIDKDEAFHFDVLSVRGKTVVAFLESFGLSADQFPAFLTDASRVLGSLAFPR
jgi:hypothetical protein